MPRIPSQWEYNARLTIHKTLAEINIPLSKKVYSDQKRAQIEKAVNDAYPFGPRRFRAYKIWLRCCDEILTQIGVREYQTPKPKIKSQTYQNRRLVDDPRQCRLF